MLEIAATLSNIKAAMDIARGIISMNRDAAVKEKALELMTVIVTLQESLISVHSAYDELLKRKNDLDARLKEYDDWAKTQSRYRLKEVSAGVYVYAHKDADKSGEPIHWLCAHCWEDRKKSVLQADFHHESAASYTCPRCKTTLVVPLSPGEPVRLEPPKKRFEDY